MVGAHRRWAAWLLALAVAFGVGACSSGPVPSPGCTSGPAPSTGCTPATTAPVTAYSGAAHSLAIPDALGLKPPEELDGPLGETAAFFGEHGEELLVQVFGSAGGDAALGRLIAQSKDPTTGATLVEETALTVPAGKAQRMVFTLSGKRVVIHAIAAATSSAVIVATGIPDDAAIAAIVDSFRFSAAP